MPEEKNKTLDLLKNEYFVQWIVQPNEESNHYWSKWLLAHPERQKDVELAGQLIQSSQYDRNEKLKDEDYNLLLENIVGYSQKRAQKQIWMRPGVKKLAGIAAAIALIISSSLLIQPVNQNQETEPPTVVTKTTLPGQKLKVQLPDGSAVTMNAESQLDYSIPFTINRTVILSGEAFFEVIKNEESPFIVQSGDITTRVLGTSFNIRSYPGEIENAVAVLTGRVQVSDTQGNEASLTPNVRGVFNLEENQLLIEPYSFPEEMGWKDGLLTFKETPIEEVITDLERWYGVNIILEDSALLAGGKYTGAYENASLEKVMQGVSYTSGFTFSLEGKKVIIHKKN